jgi:hypothetical protein
MDDLAAPIEVPSALDPRSSAPPLRIVLPPSQQRHRIRLERLVTRLVADLAGRLGTSIPGGLTLRFHPTVASYQRSTRRPWWTAATANGDRIDLVPLDVLERHQQVERTLRHEIVHVITAGDLEEAPLWVREGLAHYLAGAEGMRSPAAADEDTACPDDAAFSDAASATDLAALYGRSAACVARALAAGRTWRDVR